MGLHWLRERQEARAALYTAETAEVTAWLREEMDYVERGSLRAAARCDLEGGLPSRNLAMRIVPRPRPEEAEAAELDLRVGASVAAVAVEASEPLLTVPRAASMFLQPGTPGRAAQTAAPRARSTPRHDWSVPLDPTSAVKNAHGWFETHSGWAPPDPDTLSEWAADGVCRSPDGCLVKPDGWCQHGLASWMLVLSSVDEGEPSDPRTPEGSVEPGHRPELRGGVHVGERIIRLGDAEREADRASAVAGGPYDEAVGRYP